MMVGPLLLIGACATEDLLQPTDTAAPNPAAVAGALPATVATVRTLGWWAEEEREGPYRIVIIEQGFDKVVSRLYLQWLVAGDEPIGIEVVSTVGFRQLNELPLYNLDILDVRDRAGGLEVEVIGASPYTGDTRRFLIEADLPGVATASIQE